MPTCFYLANGANFRRRVYWGQTAAMDRFTYQQDDGDKSPPMVSKMVGIKIKKGQRLHLETPGGGGYGNPSERDTKAILRDIKLGYIDAQSAHRGLWLC